MNIRAVIASVIIAAGSFAAWSETPKSAQAAHSAMHKAQLANVKSKMDRSVVSDLLQEEITKREKAAAGILSEESDKMIADLLKEANTHIGKPYHHGSKGPKSFDCSGFSSYVYRQFGYNLSPSSRTQYTQGVNVDRNELRKGDLVFFTSRSSGKNVGHVGIVVSADNATGSFKFIHASIKGVKISEFEGYYVPRYIGARRIITE